MYYLYVRCTQRLKIYHLDFLLQPKNREKQDPPSLTCRPFFCITHPIKRHVSFEIGRPDILKPTLLFSVQLFFGFYCSSEKYYLIIILNITHLQYNFTPYHKIMVIYPCRFSGNNIMVILRALILVNLPPFMVL